MPDGGADIEFTRDGIQRFGWKLRQILVEFGNQPLLEGLPAIVDQRRRITKARFMDAGPACALYSDDEKTRSSQAPSLRYNL